MKMGTIVSLWHYDGAASPRAPIDKSAMACDLALRLMLGSVPDFAGVDRKSSELGENDEIDLSWTYRPRYKKPRTMPELRRGGLTTKIHSSWIRTACWFNQPQAQ
jgi:hypothetical protein